MTGLELDELISITIIVLLLFAVSSIQVPGTKSLDLPDFSGITGLIAGDGSGSGGGDAPQQYDVTSCIRVEGLATSATLNDDTFTLDYEESSWHSLSFVGPPSPGNLSLVSSGVEDLDVTFTLQSRALNGNLSKSEHVGRLKGDESEKACTEFTKVPPGQYTVWATATYGCIWNVLCPGMDQTSTQVRVGGR
jgi:hypothetical protein